MMLATGVNQSICDAAALVPDMTSDMAKCQLLNELSGRDAGGHLQHLLNMSFTSFVPVLVLLVLLLMRHYQNRASIRL